jgi:hypothetical protein
MWEHIIIIKMGRSEVKRPKRSLNRTLNPYGACAASTRDSDYPHRDFHGFPQFPHAKPGI